MEAEYKPQIREEVKQGHAVKQVNLDIIELYE